MMLLRFDVISSRSCRA